MALKERYTVDIILELEMGAEFGSESEEDFEGYLEEEVEENSSGEETPLEEESCMEVGEEAEEIEGMEGASHVLVYIQQPGVTADSNGMETPLEEEICMELGEEAKEKEGMKEVSQVPIYTQQPGVAADSRGMETPLEEESCMEVGEEAKEKEGTEEAAHVPIYSQQPGVTADIAEGWPIDFFRLFITSTMLQHIVSSTNLFADQYHERHDLPPRSRVREWRKTPHTPLLSSKSSLPWYSQWALSTFLKWKTTGALIGLMPQMPSPV